MWRPIFSFSRNYGLLLFCSIGLGSELQNQCTKHCVLYVHYFLTILKILWYDSVVIDNVTVHLKIFQGALSIQRCKF
jgi:hypothetical protein